MRNVLRNPQHFERALARIADDRRRGASSLARAALGALGALEPAPGASTVRYRAAVRACARRLATARPAMPPIAAAVEGALARWRAIARDASRGTTTGRARRARSLRDARRDEADASFDALRRACRAERDAMRRARAAAAARLAALAPRRPATLSTSAMVVEALRAARPGRVVVFESRPALEGRATARALARSGLRVRVSIDARMAAELDRCDAVVLGCDALLPDGSVVAKAGARTLAELAARRRIPVYVLADRWRVATARAWRAEAPREADVWARAPEGVDVAGAVFELVSARAITRVVCEDGAFRPATAARRLRAARRERRHEGQAAGTHRRRSPSSRGRTREG